MTWHDKVVRVAAFAVVAAWAGACVWLLAHGRYTAFLSAKLWPLLAAAIAMLILMLGAMAGQRGRVGSWGGRLVTLGWVALPLGYLAVAPATGLDSYALAARGVDPLAAVTVAAAPVEDATVSPSSPVAVDAEASEAVEVSLLHLLLDMHLHEGKRVAAIGMVHEDDRHPPGTFVMFRFVVACCAADASPVGAMVRTTDVPLPQANKWVRVVGRVEIVPIGQDRGPCIVADSVVPIEPPRELYLSPW